MKFLLASFFFVSVSQAAVIDCSIDYDMPYKNQFAVSIEVDEEAETVENLTLVTTLKPAGRNSVETSVAGDISGKLSLVDLQTIDGRLALRLEAVSKVNEIAYVNLIADKMLRYISQLRFKDGSTYWSTCVRK